MIVDITEDWIAEAKDRLRAWGAEDWRQRQRGGYARESLEQAMREHGFIPKATGMRKEMEKPEIVEIDEIVSQLATQTGGDKARLALWLWYAPRKMESVPSHDQYGTERSDRVEHEAGRLTELECSQVLQCSRAQFRVYRDTGHVWVAAALSRG